MMKKTMLINKLSLLRRDESKDFRKFRGYYFKHYHQFPDAEFHTVLCNWLAEMVQNRGAKIAMAAPRSGAKSTISSTEYVLYSACHKTENFILVMSSTSEQVADFMSSIKKELETNERLIRDFPDVCEINGAKPPRWKKNEIILKNGVRILALSVNQQVRGRRHGQFRPSLIILDDIEADESTKNPDNFYKLQDKITKSVIKSGDSRTNIVYVGTIHHYNSLLAKFTNPREFPGWQKGIYRAIIKWADRQDMWDHWAKIYHCLAEHQGQEGPDAAKQYFEDNRNLILEGSELLWEAKWSYYSLMLMREQDGHISFDSEMQNEPVNPRDCHFNVDELVFWDENGATEEELLNSIKNKVFFGSCDPSLGKSNQRGDYTAIITGVLDVDNNIIYILDCDVAKRKPDKTIDCIIDYQRDRNYKSFAFEVVQFQEYMANVLFERAHEEGLRINIEEVRHQKDKFTRIESLQPMLIKGKIRLSKRHGALLEQMKFFPKAPFDDALDALEMLVSIAKKPQKVQAKIIECKDNSWIRDYRNNFGWNI